MAVKLIGSAGNVNEPAVISMFASGTIWPNSVVELTRTGGQGVAPASGPTTTTTVFGVCLDYAQGASDVLVRVIPITGDQLWAIDAYNAVTTAQIGLKHILRTSGTDARGRFVENTGTDAASCTGVFRCLAIDTSVGTGKLIGYFRGGPAFDHPNYTQEDL